MLCMEDKRPTYAVQECDTFTLVALSAVKQSIICKFLYVRQVVIVSEFMDKDVVFLSVYTVLYLFLDVRQNI